MIYTGSGRAAFRLRRKMNGIAIALTRSADNEIAPGHCEDHPEVRDERHDRERRACDGDAGQYRAAFRTS
jgi:hypothetical protein